jgi:hypothetical protein
MHKILPICCKPILNAYNDTFCIALLDWCPTRNCLPPLYRWRSMFDGAEWRKRIDSRRLVVLVAALWMARVAIVGSSQSGISKFQPRSRSVGRSWTYHLSTMRRRFGRWSSNVMARLVCRLPFCDCPIRRCEPQPASHGFPKPSRWRRRGVLLVGKSMDVCKHVKSR